MFPYIIKNNVATIHQNVELRLHLILIMRWKHVQSHTSRVELRTNSFRIEYCCCFLTIAVSCLLPNFFSVKSVLKMFAWQFRHMCRCLSKNSPLSFDVSCVWLWGLCRKVSDCQNYLKDPLRRKVVVQRWALPCRMEENKTRHSIQTETWRTDTCWTQQ